MAKTNHDPAACVRALRAGLSDLSVARSHLPSWPNPDTERELHETTSALDRIMREVERLAELRNPGRDSGRYELFTAEWAEQWPAEEMWKARKAG